MFPVAEVPELPRGKGNKLFGLHAGKGGEPGERLVAITVLPAGGALKLWSGERHMGLSAADLKDYRGERAQRGAVLPRGWRKVDRAEPG